MFGDESLERALRMTLGVVALLIFLAGVIVGAVIF